MNRTDLNSRLPDWVTSLTASVLSEPRMQHLDRVFLPNRDLIIHAIKQLRQLLYPGYFGTQNLTQENLPFRLGDLLVELSDTLYDQVRGCLRYRAHIPETNGNPAAAQAPGTPHENAGLAASNTKRHDCDEQACKIISAFFDRIPAVREILATDVQAAFDSDPAAKSTDETIFCYPGLLAISVQRLAHEFYKLDVPLLPRIMTEYAHSLTGIDIHPGAKLGRSFFIDHGTGIVIGETTEIGNNVKMYQGVTLGALAPHFGQMLRGQKRHPTIEDDVTIYAATTILGGDTVIGKGSVIGGNVFLTSSIPPHTQVSMESPKLKIRERRKRADRTSPEPVDFQI